MNKITESALLKLGITELNQMQKDSIEAHSKNNNIILLSPTGSGKTLAFLLPLLERLDPDVDYVQAMIIAPSRELALQIENVFRSLQSGFKICCCYGGHSMAVEKRSLEYPTAVVVGTPGRLLDHLDKETADYSKLSMLILDEFDKSLEFGFEREMNDIVYRLSSLTHKTLTSATFATDLPEFIQMKRPSVLDFLPEETKNAKLSIKKVLSPDKDKLDTLYNLLCQLDGEPTIVFCNYRESVERTGNYLLSRGVHNEFFHGGMEQIDRERTLSKFRNGSTNIFISTDLAARGLDIPEIKHIIHYHIPSTEDAFIHRNGRTARMHASGTSYYIVYDGEELPVYLEDYKQVEKLKLSGDEPIAPKWQTIYIGKGKKNKVNKIDIVGFLCKDIGLAKEEIGMIDVKDYHIYVAILREKAAKVFPRIKDAKIKGWNAKKLLLE